MRSIKILLSFVALVTFFTFACKKSDSKDAEPITIAQLIGNYSWQSSSAGAQPATLTQASATSVLIVIRDQGIIDLQLNGNVTDGKLTIPSQIFDGETYSGSGSLSGSVLTLTLHGSNSSGSWDDTIVLTKI